MQMLFLLWQISIIVLYCTTTIVSIPYHYTYEVPDLLNKQGSSPSSVNVPFSQFSPEEKIKELKMLSQLQQAANKVVGVYPPFMPHREPNIHYNDHHQIPKNVNISSPEGQYFAEQIKRTVVVTVANMGYLSHLRNLECFARRLQMHFLVLAVDDMLVTALEKQKVQQKNVEKYDKDSNSDDELFQVVRYPGRYTDANNPPPSVIKSTASDTSTTSFETAQGFQSVAFNLISLRKFEAVYDLQRLGYNVLFVDADVVVLQDVFHMFLRPPLSEISYMHSMNHLCSAEREDANYLQKSQAQPIDGNTGFHFFQFPRSVATQKNGLLTTLQLLVNESNTEKKIENLLSVTERLPSVQLLHTFLKYIPHNEHFNPQGQFDDQTLFWRFLRAIRVTNNPNMPKSTHNKLTAHSIGLCNVQKADTFNDNNNINHINNNNNNKKDTVGAFQLCALNACQFSAGAFIYHRSLLHHASKRLDKIPSKYQKRLPDSAYSVLKNQPKRGELTVIDRETATHRLLPRHVQYTQHLMYDYVAGNIMFPKFYFPPGVSHNSYLYTMHGNYITGDVDKQQLIEDAGYWLVQSITTDNAHTTSSAKVPPPAANGTDSTVSSFRCLRFPHEVHPPASGAATFLSYVNSNYVLAEEKEKKDKVNSKSKYSNNNNNNNANKKQRKSYSKRNRNQE